MLVLDVVDIADAQEKARAQEEHCARVRATLDRLRDDARFLPGEHRFAAHFIRRGFESGLPFATLPLTPLPGDADPLGSRIGGDPVLPGPDAWPLWRGDAPGIRLPFVAQLRLDALPMIHGLPLPRTGILSFFEGTRIREDCHREEPQVALRYFPQVDGLRPVEAGALWAGVGSAELVPGELSFTYPPEFTWNGAYIEGEHREAAFAVAGWGVNGTAHRPTDAVCCLGGALRYYKGQDDNPGDWQALPRLLLHLTQYAGWPGDSDVSLGARSEFGAPFKWVTNDWLPFVVDGAPTEDAVLERTRTLEGRDFASDEPEASVPDETEERPSFEDDDTPF
ncbi:MAG: DUF1963 domain-containing protein [Nannocystales bacterium]